METFMCPVELVTAQHSNGVRQVDSKSIEK